MFKMPEKNSSSLKKLEKLEEQVVKEETEQNFNFRR